MTNNGRKNGANPALEMAKEAQDSNTGNVPYTLADGTRIAILTVSATLLDEVASRIVDPPVPQRFNPDKGKDEEYPLDPEYHRQLAANERRRNTAAMDVMAMFGIDLIDGLPQDEGWLRKLRMMEKMGHIDLSQFDMSDALDKEFVYKRYIALSAKVLGKIGSASGLSADEVARAEATFQGN
jgi:hypothetical protein